MNLIEGLQEELDRNKELLEVYKSIPTGGFGATMISQTIKAAEKAMALQDTIEMLRCYKALTENE